MSQVGETFFTVIGCMDGRCQEVLAKYGREKFGAVYPDTITEAGIVGLLANNPSQEFLDDLKSKIQISLQKHHSKGILVHGHAECAGDPVDDATHKDHIRTAVEVIKTLAGADVLVEGVFVRRNPADSTQWEVEQVPSMIAA